MIGYILILVILIWVCSNTLENQNNELEQKINELKELIEELKNKEN